MEPSQTAANYDQLAAWWRERHAESEYGVKQLQRAISFTRTRGSALDVGCGSSGRMMKVMKQAGFDVSGLDASPEMLKHAEQAVPEATYHIGDISTWSCPRKFDLICAWDSTFHLPVDLQEPALRHMAEGLAPGGVLIFTFGGNAGPGEISGSFEGQDFEYGTLGQTRFVALIAELGLILRHLEYDQGPDEKHVYLIAQNTA